MSSVALTERLLRRIEEHNPELKAFVTVTADLALRQANLADTELAEGIDRGPLHGIPIAVKDNIDTKGIRTTRGSKLFETFVPEDDSTVVRKLRASGAVLLGKAAMHEFAYGMNGINPHFGATRNPWKPDCDAGGSSSGSAAAVAAALAVAAIGTDTGGSVRQPAHSCGVVGFKPTFGQISNRGVYPLAPSMDHVGPIAVSVADTRILFRALKHKAPNDGQESLPDVGRLSRKTASTLRDLYIGIVRGEFFEGRTETVTVVERALGRLKAAGSTLVELDLAGVETALRAARTTFAEANAILWEEFSKRPRDFGDDVAAKLISARKHTPADFAQAQRFRRGFRQNVEHLFERSDVLALPTSAISAMPISARPDDHPRLAWKNCGIFNFTGHPAISLPAGLTMAGLPVGLMLVGPLGNDEALLAHAELVEGSLNWNRRAGGFE